MDRRVKAFTRTGTERSGVALLWWTSRPGRDTRGGAVPPGNTEDPGSLRRRLADHRAEFAGRTSQRGCSGGRVSSFVPRFEAKKYGDLGDVEQSARPTLLVYNAEDDAWFRRRPGERIVPRRGDVASPATGLTVCIQQRCYSGGRSSTSVRVPFFLH